MTFSSGRGPLRSLLAAVSALALSRVLLPGMTLTSDGVAQLNA